MQYKISIDHNLLTQLLLYDDPTPDMIKELKKVITVVMIKHFSKFLRFKSDFESFAILAVLERKNRYDQSYPAYNYCYTICRNEIGNKIAKLSKETFVEDILPLYNASIDPDVQADLPAEIKKFKKFLTGEQDFTVVELSPVEAVNLSVFINLNTSQRKNAVPSFIKESTTAINELYRVIQHMFYE